MTLLRAVSQRLQCRQEVFAQERTHVRASALALGLLCGVGQRTITRALGFLGWQNQDWAANYRVFSRSPWEAKELFVPVMKEALEKWIPATGPIPLAFDDTGVARSGKKIATASWQRDPMSPPFHVNLRWGQRFLQASLLLPLYRVDQKSSPRSLPVSFKECPVPKKPGKRANEQTKEAYRDSRKQNNLSQRFVQLAIEMRRQFDELGYAHRVLHLLGDGSYCNRTTFRAQFKGCTLTCRGRKDLRLCFRHEGPGRRFYGQKTFTPEEVYADPTIAWQEMLIFHGGKWRRVFCKEVKGVLWRRGGAKKSLRLIVLRERNHYGKENRRYRRKRAYLLSTDLESSLKDLVQEYFDRFEIEFNHRDEKDILGVGQAQVWAKKSVPRVPEFMVANYSLLLLSGLATYGPTRTEDYLPLPKWRRKANRASCQDLVNLLRKQIDHASKTSAPEDKISGFTQMVLHSAA
jgi:hypothetical protein